MSAIVRNLPFYDHATAVEFRGRSIPVKHDQIIVWVSLSEMGQRQLDPNAPRLPAVLDTGCNHAFVIRQRHLVEWAGEYFTWIGGRRRVDCQVHVKPTHVEFPGDPLPCFRESIITFHKGQDTANNGAMQTAR